jgi:hypothetical protein
MAHKKAILAAVSGGMGIALLLLAIHIQRDRFAFTSEDPSPDLLTHMEFPATVPPATTVIPLPEAAVPAVTLEPVIVRPSKPRRPISGIESVKPAQPACNRVWRELESGPAGRKVREICPDVSADQVPRS